MNLIADKPVVDHDCSFDSIDIKIYQVAASVVCYVIDKASFYEIRIVCDRGNCGHKVAVP